MIGDRLREMTSGCKLETHSYDAKRKLTSQQRDLVANLFSAEASSISGGRTVINGKLQEVREVNSILRAAKAYWRAMTIKYEDGVRLLRTDNIPKMRDAIEGMQRELDSALESLHGAWETVKEDAKKRLAGLYVEEDYDFDVRNCVSIVLSFPAIGPDLRLESIAPEIFEEERNKLKVKFSEAAEAMEKAVVAELASMVNGLIDKLEEKTEEDGKKRIVQQRAVNALSEFADRFDSISLSNSGEFSDLVRDIRSLADNTDVSSWKKDATGRLDFAGKMKSVKSKLEGMIEENSGRVMEF